MAILDQIEQTYNNPLGSKNQVIADEMAKYNRVILQRLYNMDLQLANIFEIMLYQTNYGDYSNGGGAGQQIAAGISGGIQQASTMLGDLTVTNIYAQKISIPFPQFEYGKADTVLYVKDITLPDSINIDFIDDNDGTVRRFLQGWMNSIGVFSSFTPQKGGYTFANNQRNAQRDMRIFLLNRQMMPSDLMLCAYGLRPMGFTQIDLDQASEGPLHIAMDFAIDSSEWLSLSGKAIEAISDAISG